VFPLGPEECASRALTLTSGDEKAELSDEFDQGEESEDAPKKVQRESSPQESPPQVSRSADIMKLRAASKAALIEKYKAILSELTLPGGELSINEGAHGENQIREEL